MLWPTVLGGVGLWGLPEATAFCIARQPSHRGQILPAALTIAVGLSVILLPIGWIVIDRIALGYSPEARAAAFLYLGFIPLNLVSSAVSSMHQGSLSIGRWNALRITVHVIYPALIVLLYLAGRASVPTFAAAMLVANVAPIVIGLILARGKGWFGGGPRREEVRALLSFGGKVHVGNTIAMLSERADQLAISLLLSPVALGLYVVAMTIGRGMSAIGETMSVLAFPKVAYAEGLAAQAAIAGRHARAVLLMSVVAAAIGIPLTPMVVVWVFGPEFASAVPVTQVLLLAVVPLNVKTVLAAVLKGVDRGLDVGFIQAASLLVSVLLLLLLLPTVGLLGAAIAFLITQVVTVAMLARKVRQRFNLPLPDFLLPKRSDLALSAFFTRS